MAVCCLLLNGGLKEEDLDFVSEIFSDEEEPNEADLGHDIEEE